MSVKMWYHRNYSPGFTGSVEWRAGEAWPFTPLTVRFLEIHNDSSEVDQLWTHPDCPLHIRTSITSIQEARGTFEGLILNFWNEWDITVIMRIFRERAQRLAVPTGGDSQMSWQTPTPDPAISSSIPASTRGPWTLGGVTVELDEDGDLRVRTPERSGFRYVIRDTFPVLLAALTDLIAEEPVEAEEELAKLWAEAEPPKPEPREDRYLVVTLEHSTRLDAPGREELADRQQNVLNRLAGEGWRLVTVALPLMYLERTDAPTKD